MRNLIPRFIHDNNIGSLYDKKGDYESVFYRTVQYSVREYEEETANV